MQFDLDDDRVLLKNSTREFLEKESPLAEARKLMEESPEGFSRALYGQLGELGYLGLALPDSEGGSGAGAIGLAAVLHEMGRVAFPGPYLDLALAAEALRRAGGQPAEEWLRGLVGGERIVLLARGETATGIEPDPPATRFADGRVRGRKLFVPFGASADALLVSCAEGIVLVPRPKAGWNTTALPTLDEAQRLVEIVLDAPGTPVAPADRTRGILAHVDRLGALGAAAVLLGLMERCLELTVAHLGERKAFGVPIGSFQSLQHRAADMLLRTESSRSAVYRAAWALDEDPEKAPYLVAVAKAYAGDSARFVCNETIQLFGGVGFTWEYDPHVYLKRAKTLEQFYGSSRSQLEVVLQEAGI